MAASISNYSAPVNPLVFHSGFQHVTEKIFQKLDKESLKSCRLISKSWKDSIAERNILWMKIIEDEEDLEIVFC